MKAHYTSCFRYSLYAGLAIFANTTTEATTVSINSNALSVSQGELVASARLRASNNSWDMALSNGQSFEPDDARRSNLSRSFASPGREYDFSLEHRAGEGMIFTVTDTRTGRSTMQAWGTFTDPPPSRNVTATLGGMTPTTAFDALQIETRATIARARTTFSDLVFSTPDLAGSGGGFYNNSITNRSIVGANPRGTATQELLADVDLSAYSWTFSGTVNFLRASGGGGADDVSLTISLRQVGSAAAVPEPAGTMMLLTALGCTLVRRRRAI